MNVILFIVIVLIILALAMWVVYYVPMPPDSPTWIKNILYVVLLLISVIVIVNHVGLLHA